MSNRYYLEGKCLRGCIEMRGKQCHINLWIYDGAFESGVATFSNEYFDLRVTSNKKRNHKTVQLRDFTDKVNRQMRSVYRYGEYTLTIKEACFTLFTNGIKMFRDANDERSDIYVKPEINLCVHPNPHHKIEPAEPIKRPYQGGAVSPR